MVDGCGSRIKRESEELRVDGAWHFPICDHNGIKRAQLPSRKVRGDRDFKATPQEWSEERYPATQRQHYLTAFNGLELTWDARNRLAYASGGEIDLYGLYECGYDVQGRLVYKDAPHGGDYLWDGWRETKVKRLKG